MSARQTILTQHKDFLQLIIEDTSVDCRSLRGAEIGVPIKCLRNSKLFVVKQSGILKLPFAYPNGSKITFYFYNVTKSKSKAHNNFTLRDKNFTSVTLLKAFLQNLKLDFSRDIRPQVGYRPRKRGNECPSPVFSKKRKVHSGSLHEHTSPSPLKPAPLAAFPSRPLFTNLPVKS